MYMRCYLGFSKKVGHYIAAHQVHVIYNPEVQSGIATWAPSNRRLWSWKSSLLSFHIRFCECTTLSGWNLVPVTPVDRLCIPVFAGLSTVPSGPGFQPPNSIIGIILSGIKCSSLPLPGPPAAHSSCGNFFVASTLHDHWPRCNTMAHQHHGVAAGQDLRKFSFWNSQTSTLEFPIPL